MLKVVLIVTACFYLEVQSAKILAVFPMPSISHQVVFRKITQELVNRGHEVTVITPDPAYPNGNAPPNLKEIDVHDISYGFWQKIFSEKYKVEQLKVLKFTEFRQGALLFTHIVKLQVETPEVQKLIANKDNKFDLILIEAFMRPALAFSHIFKAPVILVSSMGAIFSVNNVIGSSTHPLLYPSTTVRKRFYNLTLCEKFNELYEYYMFEYANYLNQFDENEVLKQVFGPDLPPTSELYNNVDLLLLNLHPIWNDNQPVPPGVVYMGGIHQIPQKELPEDLKAYLDSSKNGVIYVSFGTNVLAGMMPERKIEIIAKVLSKQPYDVLWKWDNDELPGKGDNIKIGKWFPQSDLLRHPKIKLFVMQAGLQSTDEAITAGVPLIAIPMLGDQWYNAEKYVKHGIGMKFEMDSITEEEFKHAVETVINDKSYRENIEKLRVVLRDEPEPPLQRTMWWIEYVLRHGGAKQLRAPGANITYYEYFAGDVLLVLLSSVLLIIILACVAISLIFKLISNSLSQKKIKSSQINGSSKKKN